MVGDFEGGILPGDCSTPAVCVFITHVLLHTDQGQNGNDETTSLRTIQELGDCWVHNLFPIQTSKKR